MKVAEVVTWQLTFVGNDFSDIQVLIDAILAYEEGNMVALGKYYSLLISY